MAIRSINPATEELLGEFSPDSDRELDVKLEQSANAFSVQKRSTFSERSSCLNRAADILMEEKENLARTITMEMGKTLVSARAEVEKCSWVCRYYAEHAATLLQDALVKTSARKSLKRYLPIGPVLAVMPWNYPFWQVFRFAAPALMAGNTALLKHASNVPQSALAIEALLQKAGFIDGAFTTLLIGSDKVEKVLRDQRVRAATLTGSGPAGSAVAAIAGSEIKKTVLELGGSDPFIVMPSANFHAAVDCAVKARIQNNGQSCIAAKRFIVHQDIYDSFRDAFVDRFEQLVIGNPMDALTEVGPLATKQIRSDCMNFVRQLEGIGARRLTGAESIDRLGYFFRPGIVEVPPTATHLFQDEIFGPVALLYKAGSIKEAIDIGNATPFGLGSALFTEDEAEMEYAFNQLDAGSTFINTLVASHPHLPFGGIKASGYGRELASDGIREFTNIKTLYIA